MLAAISVQADVYLPRIRPGGAHLHADLAPDATALDTGRTDGRADAAGTDRAVGLAIKFIFIGQAAVPVPLLIRCSVPGADPQQAAGDAVQAVAAAAFQL